MSGYEMMVETRLAKLGLEAKARLLAGQGMWSLPAIPEIGLAPVVFSDGPIGVRGVRWTAADPSIALPSPTALAATWDPDLARRAGNLLAQEARRKGVHVLLAPTVNLHRSPLGGRHFECYSEDPLLTAEIGIGYVRGVQAGGVGTTVKHLVANDAETERFTVNNRIGARALRELYLAPFEAIVKRARPWALMAAYNSVNGTTMTEHDQLNNDVLREQWKFDGALVSDWFAARDTAAAVTGGLDIAMPGPHTVYGDALVAAVRAGDVDESVVDERVRNVLRLAARVGALDDVPAVVDAEQLPGDIDGRELAREIARHSFVLLRNDNDTLPLEQATSGRIAVIGGAARDVRILGGGSALVFPDRVVSPLDGLRTAVPDGIELTYALGANPSDELAAADTGFDLRAIVRGSHGRILGQETLPAGVIQWHGEFPAGVRYDDIRTIEIAGTFVPREGGRHAFGTKGLGGFRLTVADTVLFDGQQDADTGDPFDAFFAAPVNRGEVELTAGEQVEVSLVHTIAKDIPLPIDMVACTLAHREPHRDPDELIEEAVATASGADTAIVVVATTDGVESEGFDRASLALPGPQDELVRRVAAANSRTVVVVNAGSPVEMPWREEVAAVLLSWFPGQEAGTALADVLLGTQEPGGRLPTTWPARLANAPVTQVTPTDGELAYDEGVFIGYRAWQREVLVPAYCFGHGLGYTTWDYQNTEYTPGGGNDELGAVTVRVRNTGDRAGREVIQVYLAVPDNDPLERPIRALAGFATVQAAPGQTAEATITLPRRAVEVWDEQAGDWWLVPGDYTIEAGRSGDDLRQRTAIHVAG